jgi:hypothetical protein
MKNSQTIADISFQVTVTGQMISNQLEKAGLAGEGAAHIREAIIMTADSNGLAQIWNSLMGVDVLPVVEVGDSVRVTLYDGSETHGKVTKVNRYAEKPVKVEYVNSDNATIERVFYTHNVVKLTDVSEEILAAEVASKEVESAEVPEYQSKLSDMIR